MKKGFAPEEILFCITTDCNLKCPHCVTSKSKKIIKKDIASAFIRKCGQYGIKKIGFTGGEPFLAVDHLSSLIKTAVKCDMLFDRIMTNAVWHKSKKHLSDTFQKLYESGYDGSVCVSIDAFHNQDLFKVKDFIEQAMPLWPVSIAVVTGAKDSKTRRRLKELSRLLGARLYGLSYIKSGKLFIPIIKIGLSPVGSAERLKNPWDGKWFNEDFCRGPGNVLYVMPNGDIKPCCGYATDMPPLTVYNIMRKNDYRISDILDGIRKNRFVRTIFNSGLSKIRHLLEREGIVFPGKTTNHCFFCYYILKNVPTDVLNKCLD